MEDHRMLRANRWQRDTKNTLYSLQSNGEKKIALTPSCNKHVEEFYIGEPSYFEAAQGKRGKSPTGSKNGKGCHSRSSGAKKADGRMLTITTKDGSRNGRQE